MNLHVNVFFAHNIFAVEYKNLRWMPPCHKKTACKEIKRKRHNSEQTRCWTRNQYAPSQSKKKGSSAPRTHPHPKECCNLKMGRYWNGMRNSFGVSMRHFKKFNGFFMDKICERFRSYWASRFLVYFEYICYYVVSIINH